MSDWYVAGITFFFLLAMFLLGFLTNELLIRRREVKEIMATLDEILDVVTQTSGTADSIVALVQGLKDQIAELGILTPEQQAKVDAIFDVAVANKAKLDAAVNA